jgi:hypothetical protein
MKEFVDVRKGDHRRKLALPVGGTTSGEPCSLARPAFAGAAREVRTEIVRRIVAFLMYLMSHGTHCRIKTYICPRQSSCGSNRGSKKSFWVYLRGTMTTGRENGKSKLVSVRLTYKMIDDLKKAADKLGEPYQTVMKAAIEQGLPIVRKGATKSRLKREVTTYRALNLDAAMEKLKKTRPRKG